MFPPPNLSTITHRLENINARDAEKRRAKKTLRVKRERERKSGEFREEKFVGKGKGKLYARVTYDCFGHHTTIAAILDMRKYPPHCVRTGHPLIPPYTPALIQPPLSSLPPFPWLCAHSRPAHAHTAATRQARARELSKSGPTVRSGGGSSE